jgi:hypothetical protein
MSDDLLFNLAISGTDGRKTPFQFTKAGLRDLIVQMLSITAQAPLKPDLERQLTLDEHPIPTNGFVVTPLEDHPDGAHVSIGIGPIDLQFAVSLPVLMEALGALKEATEPDPTSPHRPN